jgi:excisionase family DNA binding protein
MKRYGRTPHVAVALNCSTRTVERLTAAGKLPVVRLGGRNLYDLDAIDETLRQQAA